MKKVGITSHLIGPCGLQKKLIGNKWDLLDSNGHHKSNWFKWNQVKPNEHHKGTIGTIRYEVLTGPSEDQ